MWTKRVGNNPKLKVLLLHGGPGVTHEYFEAFDSYLPAAGIEYYLLRPARLGLQRPARRPGAVACGPPTASSTRSSRCARHCTWTSDNFCLLGHSWGGILAIEYALKYPQHLKCLVISNMVSSIPAYNAYAHERADAGDGPEGARRRSRSWKPNDHYDDPRYVELLLPMHYEQHILRMPRRSGPTR